VLATVVVARLAVAVRIGTAYFTSATVSRSPTRLWGRIGRIRVFECFGFLFAAAAALAAFVRPVGAVYAGCHDVVCLLNDIIFTLNF
jgi:hypothetical protein